LPLKAGLAGQTALLLGYGAAGAVADFAVAFAPEAAGQNLTFTAVGNSFPFNLLDEQTGSTWNLAGEAISGELAGQQLARIDGFNAFWFAWAAFYPEIDLQR
jgi:hypothetical protein